MNPSYAVECYRIMKLDAIAMGTKRAQYACLECRYKKNYLTGKICTNAIKML